MSDMTQLEARVRAAIESHRPIGDPASIAVSVDEIGSVTLRGTLPSHVQSHAAARAARGVPGVLNVINEIDVKPLDPRRSPDAPQAGRASAEPEPDAGLGRDATAQREGLDDEVEALLQESEGVERSEERAKTSISEEWRTEHWGREPEHPPTWDKPGPADGSKS